MVPTVPYVPYSNIQVMILGTDCCECWQDRWSLNVLNYGDNWGEGEDAIEKQFFQTCKVLHLFYSYCVYFISSAVISSLCGLKILLLVLALKSCFWCFLHSFTQPKDVKEIKALTLLTFSLCNIFFTCFLSSEHCWSRKRYILQAQNFSQMIMLIFTIILSISGEGEPTVTPLLRRKSPDKYFSSICRQFCTFLHSGCKTYWLYFIGLWRLYCIGKYDQYHYLHQSYTLDKVWKACRLMWMQTWNEKPVSFQLNIR